MLNTKLHHDFTIALMKAENEDDDGPAFEIAQKIMEDLAHVATRELVEWPERQMTCFQAAAAFAEYCYDQSMESATVAGQKYWKAVGDKKRHVAEALEYGGASCTRAMTKALCEHEVILSWVLAKDSRRMSSTSTSGEGTDPIVLYTGSIANPTDAIALRDGVVVRGDEAKAMVAEISRASSELFVANLK